jgi:hypothetical protein
MQYRHYKGGIYEVVCEATIESDLTPLIVYKAADGSEFFDVPEMRKAFVRYGVGGRCSKPDPLHRISSGTSRCGGGNA